MHILSGYQSNDNPQRVSFLNTGPAGQIDWRSFVVGRNNNLNLPYPGYFRLSPEEMSVSHTEGYTTWDLRHERDDGVPDWREIYYTQVAIWHTENGQVQAEFLHRVQVALLVVGEYGMTLLDRSNQQVPVEQGDYSIKFYRPPSTMIEVLPERSNVWRKMLNPPKSREEKSNEVANIIRAGSRGFGPGSMWGRPPEELEALIAPVIRTEVLQAQIAAEAGRARRWEETRRDHRKSEEKKAAKLISNLSDARLAEVIEILESTPSMAEELDDVFSDFLD